MLDLLKRWPFILSRKTYLLPETAIIFPQFAEKVSGVRRPEKKAQKAGLINAG